MIGICFAHAYLELLLYYETQPFYPTAKIMVIVIGGFYHGAKIIFRLL